MFTIDDLADRLGGYLPPDEIQQVKRAFYYAEQAHDGQRPRHRERRRVLRANLRGFLDPTGLVARFAGYVRL